MNDLVCFEDGLDAVFHIRVTTRTSKTEISGVEEGSLRVRVTAAPVDGAANSAVIACIAGALRIPKTLVSIASGYTSRSKRVRVAGTSCDDVMRAIERR